MFRNYLKTALKAFSANKIYSSVNVFGLTIGLASCMLIATVVMDDLSYDKQWSRSKDLFRINSNVKLAEGLYDRSSGSISGIKDELKKNFPEVEAVSTINKDHLRLKFNESESSGIPVISLRADTAIWRMLDIKVIAGNPKSFVEGQNNLLISEKIRDKFFPGRDPVGAIVYDISDDGGKPEPYLITGVIQNLPENTHLRAEVIELTKRRIEPLSHLGDGSFRTQYLLMRPGTDMTRFTGLVNNWYDHFLTRDNRYKFDFQPIGDIYLHSAFASNQEIQGNIRNIYIFSAVAILLLLIACLNFINLSTARALTRIQETGVRKVLGAGKQQIIFQFLTEALLYFAISTVLALVIYQISLPAVVKFLGHTLVMTFMSGITLFLLAGGVILAISLFTGIYPALLLSRFKAANALKGSIFAGSQGQNKLRKSLVIIQFSISILVLIAMIVVRQQVRFMENKDLGFDKKGLLRINRISWEGKAEVLKHEIKGIPGVEQCSVTTFNPAQAGGFMHDKGEDPEHPGKKIDFWYIIGDIDFPETIGLRLKSGRVFKKELGSDVFHIGNIFHSDSLQQIFHLQPSLITASTARMLHIKKLDEPLKNGSTTPVGIVEDFHNESLRLPVGPTFILAQRSPDIGVMLVRVKAGAEKQVTASLKNALKKVYPGKAMDIDWVEDLLKSQYAAEARLQQLFSFFSLLTMILASLGVFGLVVHAAGQRVKEIGVRKVLGASVASLVGLLSADFIKLVVLAILISSPLSWWMMNKWLEDYAYRVPIHWWVFALAGTITLLIAMITISFQAIKSALTNPVKSLRSE